MRVKNFASFMKSRSVNEQNYSTGYNPNDMRDEYAGFGDDSEENEYYGANPEDEDMPEDTEKDEDTDTEDGEETEEVTLDDLKTMIEDLTARVEKLEGGEEGEEEEPAEGEEGEGEEPAEGEEAPEEA